LRTYLADPSVRTYVGRNLFFIGHAYSIAGVFADNPVRTVVNGSLWTIPNEVRCYLALAVAGTVGALRSRVAVLALFLLLLIAHIAVPMTFHPVYAVERRLALSFLSGVTLYLWRDRVMLSGPLAVALPALAIILPMGEMRATAIFLAASYAMLVVAFRSPASIKRSSSQVPDYSYGIYIYAFPVQQALVALGIGTSPVINVVTTLPLILIFAAASWHMVEAPALRLKPQGVRVRGLPHGSGA